MQVGTSKQFATAQEYAFLWLHKHSPLAFVFDTNKRYTAAFHSSNASAEWSLHAGGHVQAVCARVERLMRILRVKHFMRALEMPCRVHVQADAYAACFA